MLPTSVDTTTEVVTAALPRKTTTLEFPEIEKTGGCDPEADDVFLPLPEPRARARAASRARDRFSAAATTVLTQVVESRSDVRRTRNTPERTCSDSEAMALPVPSAGRDRVCRSLSYRYLPRKVARIIMRGGGGRGRRGVFVIRDL